MSEPQIISEQQLNKEPWKFALPIGEKYSYYYAKKKGQCLCFALNPTENGHTIESSYFIGVDWIGYQQQTIYVEPKLNNGAAQTNYLAMLFSALKHPEVSKYTNELFEIKFDQPKIRIKQEQDLLTPLLIVQFLSVVKAIVRKGLKKSYYRVDQNLYSRVKGKVLTSSTIKHNLLKNKPLHTHCSFDEFGLNGLENRLLKKALVFVQRYLPTIKNLNAGTYTQNTFNYILPAFKSVSEEVSLNDIKHQKKNAFYQEYEEGIRLAKLILQRFGYNITNVQKSAIVETPPFWIDMSKLFELYVLGLLKDRFGNEIRYHVTKHKNELDFLLDSAAYKMVVDAKYKTVYTSKVITNSINEDIRQLSGYARLKHVYELLEVDQNKVLDCLIVFPDQENGIEDLIQADLKDEINEIDQYVQFYSLGVKLPTI